jgi:acetyl-CoA C-acetyltransferase
MVDCLIYDAIRTPRGKGKKGGALQEVTPIKLAGTVLRSLKERNEIPTEHVGDIIFGCVEPVEEQGGCLPRIAALDADYDQRAPGVQINRFCASGLEATNMAAAKVSSGQVDMAVSGGVESMSRISMGASGGAWATDPQVAAKTHFIPQGISADLVATKFGYTREGCDQFAVQSQKRAAHAWEMGWFKNSVVPVSDMNGIVLLQKDEHVRPDSSVESLANLSPSFGVLGQQFGFNDVALQRYPEVERIEHVHHAGNSSGIVDGAAAILLGSQEAGQLINAKPRARIVSCASIGSEPCIMLTGPADAANLALKRAKMDRNDIDLWEVNEAFASVVLHFMNLMDLSDDVVNVAGGSIAMGHPLGATGAMLVGTVLDELERRDLRTALITLCVGAGMGTATIIERV